MKIFDGKAHAAAIDEYIKQKLRKHKPDGKLLIVLVGDNPASLRYIKVKMNLCEKLGILVSLEHIDERLTDEEISSKVKLAFENKNISGGIIQLPLPRKSLQKILDLIPAHKDVDLISSIKVEQFYRGDFSSLPPVVRAFNYFLLNSMSKESFGRPGYLSLSQSTLLMRKKAINLNIYIIGKGLLVGKPLTRYLSALKYTISNSNKYNTGDKIYSDFLVSGAGVPNLINGQDVSQSCNVIDFGTSVLDGKVVGDFNKNSKIDHLGMVSFSPGGIGPVVVRFLLLNFLGL